jgi:hypothetical protein
MSIERIGNGNTMVITSVNKTGRQTQPPDRRADMKNPSPVGPKEVADLTKIADPPFLPAGHTQAIFKEKK